LRGLFSAQAQIKRKSATIASRSNVGTTAFRALRLNTFEAVHGNTLQIVGKTSQKVNQIRWASVVISSPTSATIHEQKTEKNEHTHGNESSQGSTKGEAEKRNRIVALWLFSCCGLIFAMIVLGGVTRLTNSGLSIVDWKPVVGSVPPLTQADWNEEFEKYKRSPEYQKLNYGMSMEDFQKIFWMEWSHRQLGRFIGLAFALPLLFFSAKRWVRGSLLLKCTGLLGLGGFQGFLGWYMVKSGLDHKTFEGNNAPPRVSQYRLAIHLMSALFLYTAVLWQGLNLYMKRPQVSWDEVARLKLRNYTAAVTLLVFTTVFSGAFVAGLDAGLIYNTFPLMGGKIIPDDIYNEKLGWKNIFENDTTVQFDHRVLGISTFSAIVALYVYARRYKWNNMPRPARGGFNALLGLASLQVTLGITTLLTYVPVPLAASHQAGAVSLLTAAIVLLRILGRKPLTIKLPTM